MTEAVNMLKLCSDDTLAEMRALKIEQIKTEQERLAKIVAEIAIRYETTSQGESK